MTNNDFTFDFKFSEAQPISLDDSAFFLDYEVGQRENDYGFLLKKDRNNSVTCRFTYFNPKAEYTYFPHGMLAEHYDKKDHTGLNPSSSEFFNNKGDCILSINNGKIKVGTISLLIVDGDKYTLYDIERKRYINPKKVIVENDDDITIGL